MLPWSSAGILEYLWQLLMYPIKCDRYAFSRTRNARVSQAQKRCIDGISIIVFCRDLVMICVVGGLNNMTSGNPPKNFKYIQYAGWQPRGFRGFAPNSIAYCWGDGLVMSS